jgi:hypothetical protein
MGISRRARSTRKRPFDSLEAFATACLDQGEVRSLAATILYKGLAGPISPRGANFQGRPLFFRLALLPYV